MLIAPAPSEGEYRNRTRSRALRQRKMGCDVDALLVAESLLSLSFSSSTGPDFEVLEQLAGAELEAIEDMWFFAQQVNNLETKSDHSERSRGDSICSIDSMVSYASIASITHQLANRLDALGSISPAASRLNTLSTVADQNDSCEQALGHNIGAYSPRSRKLRIKKFLEKRKRRVWTKKVDYDVRKHFADSRLRVKGRFVKKEHEEILCSLMAMV